MEFNDVSIIQRQACHMVHSRFSNSFKILEMHKQKVNDLSPCLSATEPCNGNTEFSVYVFMKSRIKERLVRSNRCQREKSTILQNLNSVTRHSEQPKVSDLRRSLRELKRQVSLMVQDCRNFSLTRKLTHTEAATRSRSSLHHIAVWHRNDAFFLPRETLPPSRVGSRKPRNEPRDTLYSATHHCVALRVKPNDSVMPRRLSRTVVVAWRYRKRVRATPS